MAQLLNVLSPDAGATYLADLLKSQTPFFFIRYGDGALECIHKLGRGKTCDGEHYGEELADALVNSWMKVCRAKNLIIGDWRSASFDGKVLYEKEYEFFLQKASEAGATPAFVHFESLLLMRDSEALWNFYRTVRKDPRRKLLMGPQGIAVPAKMLEADYIEVPMVSNLLNFRAAIRQRLLASNFEVLLYGAGMAGNAPVVDCWERYPDKTYINLGSALDPLFRGRTRKQQMIPSLASIRFFEATRIIGA